MKNNYIIYTKNSNHWRSGLYQRYSYIGNKGNYIVKKYYRENAILYMRFINNIPFGLYLDKYIPDEE